MVRKQWPAPGTAMWQRCPPEMHCRRVALWIEHAIFGGRSRRFRRNTAPLLGVVRATCAPEGVWCGDHATPPVRPRMGVRLCGCLRVWAELPLRRLQNVPQNRWQELWDTADVVVEGDRLTQKTARLNTYHLLTVASPNLVHVDAGLPFSGLTAPSNGNVMWDELLLFPFFLTKFPEVCKAHLRYRASNLKSAKKNAEALGFQVQCAAPGRPALSKYL